jgi:hypothetical protein
MKTPIKNAIIGLLALIASLIFVAEVIVKKDDKFPVTYFSEQKRANFESAPAEYRVDISPKLALEKAKELPAHKILKVISYIAVGGVVILIILGAADKTDIFVQGNGGQWLCYILLAVYLFTQYGASSAILTNNSVNVAPADFIKITNVSDTTVKYVKDNSGKDLEKLFDKPLIR